MEKLLHRQEDGGSAPLQWLQVTNPRENRDGKIVLGSDRWMLVDADGEWAPWGDHGDTAPHHPLTCAVSLGHRGWMWAVTPMALERF